MSAINESQTNVRMTKNTRMSHIYPDRLRLGGDLVLDLDRWCLIAGEAEPFGEGDLLTHTYTKNQQTNEIQT